VNGKIYRNLPVSGEKALLPSPVLPGELEGGRQIDPFLVANLQIQELQRRIESLLESESRSREELSRLRQEREAERSLLEEERAILRQEAAAEAERSRQQAERAGFEEGYRKGLAQAMEEARRECLLEVQDRFGKLEALSGKICAELKRALEESGENHARALLQLWKIALEKLLHREVALDTEAAWRLFRAILQRVGDRSRVRVLLNPSDRELFLSRGQEMDEIRRMAENFELIPDEGIEKGSCLVDTNLGVYDARWKSQLDVIGKEVDRLLGGSEV
jgi:flagellar assembly protein FliH